jgi:hypothetical protein
MKNNRLIILLSTTLVIAMTIVACKDHFNESDFLNLNNKLRNQADTSKFNQQVAAFNDAGELLSFTVQVVEDRTPLAGVDVSISNDVSSSALTSKVTTDANGNAVFTKVRIGSNTILLSKSGYISATAILDFGTVVSGQNYTTVTGANNVTNVVPIKLSKSALLPLFANGNAAGKSTATIEGKVTIETDLTNRTPEVPQNLTIVANYASGLASTVTGNSGVTVISYSFNQAGIGVAKVDNATGAYSMVVPASAAGMQMSLLLPTIDATQKVAAINLDGLPIATGPAYMNVATSFGPTVGFDNSVPVVPGAVVVFPAPAAAGSGLGFKFTAYPGPLSANTWDTYNSGVSPNEGDPSVFDIGNAAYQLTSRGAAYTSSPTITLSGGGTSPVPTQATMKASLQGFLSSVSINAPGTGYVTGDVVTLQLRFKESVGNTNVNMGTVNATVTATSGAITAYTLPTSGYAISTAFHTDQYGTSSNGFNVASFDVLVSGGTGTGATVNSTFSTTVDAIALTSVGANYTSAPSITFTGGGSTSQATMVIKEFRTQWAITPDNSGNTTPYTMMPTSILFEFTGMNMQPVQDGNVRDQFNNSSSYWGHLSVQGGGVVQTDPTLIFRTNKFSAAAPAAVVVATQASTAKALANVNLTTGAVTSLYNISTGSGYNAVFKPTIQPAVAGAPGAAAVADLASNFTVTGGEYKWSGGYVLTNQGSGYLADLNQQNNAPVSSGAYNFNGNTSSFLIKTGDVQVFNFNYGTGKRKQNIN